MDVVKSLALASLTLGLATASLAAGLDTTQPMTGKLMVARGQASVKTQVEYCMRNLPELTELPSRARIETSTEEAAEFDLKQARSMGFNRLCPNLVAFMHDSTAASLAKMYGDALASLQRQFQPAP
jgi:hypothetical protein